MGFQFSIQDYFENILSEFTNQNGVSFILLSTLDCIGGVLLTADYPGFISSHASPVDLIIWIEYKLVEDLETFFCIKSKEDLEKITVNHLFDRFKKGKAVVECIFDGFLDKKLSFSKISDLLIASDDNDQTHIVENELQKPEDFISYTKEYYRI